MSAAVLRILPKPRGRQPSSSPAVLNLYPNYRSGLHFIYAIGFAGGVVKIGRSRNPRERLRQHWSKVEGQVQWIHLFEGGTKHYAYLVEAGAAYVTMQADGSVVGLNTKASTQAPHTSQTSWGTWGVASQPALTTRAHTMLAINGGYLGGNNSTTGNTSGTGHIGLGACARSDGAFSNYWNGDLQDVLIWPRMLTAAEMIQVQMWACDKYTQAYPWSAYSNLMVFSGDSLTAGAVASNVVTASSYPYKLMQDAGRPYGAWTNIGVRSFTIDELTARDTAWTDPIPSLIGKPTTLCAWEWYNQKSDGHPGVYNKALTYIAARKAVANQRIVWGTSTCYNVADASRVSYNSAMDAAGLVANNLAQGYVPIHNNSFIGVEGAYAANPTYYSDTIHMSDIGYTAMKALFDAELVARGLYA